MEFIGFAMNKKKLCISVISAFPPLKDNYGAPTALLYQLLRHPPAGSVIDLYYYDLVGAPEELVRIDLPTLGLRQIHKLLLTRAESNATKSQNHLANRIIKRIKFKFRRNYRATLPQQVSLFRADHLIVEKINTTRPDMVWLYPYWLVNWIEVLDCKNIVISGMDSAFLHYERSLRYGNWAHPREAQAYVDHLALNYNLENKIAGTRARVHMVGQEDARKFNLITNTQKAFFVPYPHHHYKAMKEGLNHCRGKINVAITGGNYETYVGDHLKRLITALVAIQDPPLKNIYHFHFIGKGYEEYARMLRNSGFEVSIQERVPDYASTLATYQVQVFPIAVGTGTKGKVVSALASGLLGVGSHFAFENINIAAGQDSVLYEQPEDIVKILWDIHQNRPVYAEVAERATEKVRKFHAPRLTADLFWQSASSGF
jgi:hypothetical protein